MGKNWAVFKANYQVNFTYRAALVIQTLRDIIITGLFIFLWQVLFKNHSQIGGYTFQTIVVYYILVRLFDRFYTFYPARTLNRNIRTGDLSNFLIKPIFYPINLAFYSLGQRLAATTITILVAGGLFIFFPQIITYPPTWTDGVFFLFFAFLSWIMFYELVICFGVISFWSTEIGNIRMAFDQIILLLGGLMIPLDLLPTWLTKIIDYLPFKYLFFFLVQVYQGKIDKTSLARNFAIEVGWILFLGVMFYVFWNKGIRKYESYGK